MLKDIKKEIKSHHNKERAEHSMSFFKTKKGQYGAGDIFYGLTVPQSRIIAKKYKDLELADVKNLLESKVHEERLIALLILISQFEKSSDPQKELLYKFLLQNIKNVNNWDLVDFAAPSLIGEHLLDKDKKILYTFAKSANLWEKRIAIVATLTFIRKGNLDDTLKISKILLGDKHDLIHKAVGWALRELGKKDQELLEDFLTKNIRNLPRTTLRYAIERFQEKKRQKFLKM